MRQFFGIANEEIGDEVKAIDIADGNSGGAAAAGGSDLMVIVYLTDPTNQMGDFER